MSLFPLFRPSRFPRLNVSVALLILFLQRVPVMRWLAGADVAAGGFASRAFSWAVKSVVGLGGYHSLAGATPAASLTTNPVGPIAKSVGETVQVAVRVGASGTATILPESYRITNLPPGLTLKDAVGGYVNVAPGVGVAIVGTPTTSGTTIATIEAWDDPHMTGSSAGPFPLTFTISPSVPVVTQQPRDFAIARGYAAQFSVAGSGGGLSYQWQKNGVALSNSSTVSGATTATLSLSDVQDADDGLYRCRISNTSGAVTTNAAVLDVQPPDPGRLVNISTRGLARSGQSALVPGFVLNGPGTKTLLVRAGGPSLRPILAQGNPNPPVTAADLTLVLHRIQNASASYLKDNDNWGSAASNPSLAALATALGAYDFIDGEKDAAFVEPLPAGIYTVTAAVPAGAVEGISLVEVYDADSPSAAANKPRLVNLSTRGPVGGASGNLVGGFVLSGNVPKTFLIRAVGPSLVTQGVSDFLADPKMELYRIESGLPSLVRANDDWVEPANSPALITSTATAVGAFALDASKDTRTAALVVTLYPGVYTTEISAVNATAGIALFEIYEVN